MLRVGGPARQIRLTAILRREDLNMRDDCINHSPLQEDVLWKVFPLCDSSQKFRAKCKKLAPQLVALDEQVFAAAIARWVVVLSQLKHPEFAKFVMQEGLCSNDLEFLNLRCAVTLRGQKFYDAVRSGQWNLATECQPDVSVWIGLSEMVLGVLWAASYQRTGDVSLFDRLLSDDDYLSLLVTDFFAPPGGPLIEFGPDEWLQQLTIGCTPERTTALLHRLEQSMSDVEGLPLQMPSCSTRAQHVVVPQLGCVRHGSIMIDPHGEKRWVYSAAMRSTGEVEIMTFRRQGRSNVVLTAAGKWQLVSA